MSIYFARLIQKEAEEAVKALLSAAGPGIGVYDVREKLLAGRDVKSQDKPLRPVFLSEKTIGYVAGADFRAESVARVLSYFAEQELERKRLMSVVLDKNSEIHLITEVSEKMASLRDVEDIALLVVDQATATIESTGASVMLLNEDSGALEIVAAFGKKFAERPVLRIGVGIVGDVMLTAQAEVINDVTADPRFVPGAKVISSLICAPIVFKDRVIGAVNVSSEKPMNYREEDKNLVSVLARQAGIAIENLRYQAAGRESLSVPKPAPEPAPVSKPAPEPAPVAFAGEDFPPPEEGRYDIGIDTRTLNRPAPERDEPAPEPVPAGSGRVASPSGLFFPDSLLACFGHSPEEPLAAGDSCREEMSVIIVDIRSFSEHLGSMDPRQNFRFLNDFIKQIEPVVVRNQGGIVQWVGDGQMALFPDAEGLGADKALEAALMIQKTITDYSKKREDRLQLPVSVGIGVSTGMTSIGILGFDSGLVTTVIGETVTVASRLERFTKRYGIRIGASEQTLRKVSNRGRFLLRDVDMVEVPGIAAPITILDVFNEDPPAVREAKIQCLDLHKKAIELYRAGDFTEAAKLFERQKRFLPFDKVADIYIARCTALSRNPPKGNWNGVTRLTD